jgi:integrase
MRWWMDQQAGSVSAYLFPSPRVPNKPIRSVKTAWRNTLKRAGVPHFKIYLLRSIYCTRLSGVAADAVVDSGMRHTSPQTKRRYQLGMTDLIRIAMEEGNKQFYGESVHDILMTVLSESSSQVQRKGVEVTGS